MRKWIFFILFFVFVALLLPYYSCRGRTTLSPKDVSSKESTEKENILKLAEEIAIKHYGVIIQEELPLIAKLKGDSMWVVQGTLKSGAYGGVVYMELRKDDHKLIKITHSK